MNDRELITAFCDLFDGNHEAIGLDIGGCARLNAPEMWKERIEQHLRGEGAIGVYPLAHRAVWQGQVGDDNAAGWTVKWGCVDLDVRSDNHPGGDYESPTEAHTAALNMSAALCALDMTGWIERTKSNGRHVWLFAEHWVPAETMRNALLVACRIADVPPSEIYPKQTELREGQVGNYARAPYPGGLREHIPPSRYMCDQNGTASISLEAFLNLAPPNRAPRVDLERAAKLYQSTPVSTVHFDNTTPRVERKLTKKLNGLGWKMLNEGPLEGEGCDRSAFLFKLACQARESELTATEAAAIVGDADTRWTKKYVERPDFDVAIRRTVENAYGRTAA